MRIRPLRADDLPWARERLVERWGSLRVVTRGRLHYPDRLPGFVAVAGGERVGLVTYRREAEEAEIVTLDAWITRQGVGRALLNAVLAQARQEGCRRVWLVTTNDNAPAQAFYEALGFSRVAVHTGAVEAARRLKPEIPRVGVGGVEIRDEIEYERGLA